MGVDMKSADGLVMDSGTIRRPTLRRMVATVDPKEAAEQRRKLAASDPARRWLKIIPWIGIVPSLGIVGVLVWLAWRSVPKHNFCLVLQDDFNGDQLDPNTWIREQGVGGFGNGEFQWYTNEDKNAYVRDGRLFIYPTLTSDDIGLQNVLNGYALNLTNNGCLGGDGNCYKFSNITNGTIINPVKSAKLRVAPQFATKYGKGEIRVKMPSGDWLWPAVWMMPQDSLYGPWPKSGEIDIVESRGNSPGYPGGNDKMQSSIHYGFDFILQKTETQIIKRRHGTLANQFRTIGWEWTPEYFLTWLDSPLRTNLYIPFNERLFTKNGGFGQRFANGTLIEDPWSASNINAPFDEKFFLILQVAVGGTNGFFPDGAGNKPWINSSPQAMVMFLQDLNKWYNGSWPQNEDRAMQVDYVKIWKICEVN